MLILRLLVTAAVAALPFALVRVLLPLADAKTAAAYGSAPLSIAAAGLSPFVTSFLLVELASVLTPPLWPLRSSPDGRARLRRAVRLLTAVLAFVQAMMIARSLLLIGAFGASRFTTFAFVTLTLTAGTAVLVAAAEIVDRIGVGNGVAILVGPAYAWDTALGLGRIPAGTNPPASFVLFAVLVLGIAMLVRRGPRAFSRSGLAGASLRQPAAGYLGVNVAAGILMFFTIMATVDPGLAVLQGKLAPGTRTYAVTGVVIAAIASAVLTWFIAKPRSVAALWSRALGGDPGDHLPAARDTVRLAAVISGAVAAVPFVVLAHPLTASLSAILVALSVALVLDLVAELRARATHGDLVAVWPLARPYEVEPVLAVLEREGIPALAQNAAWAALMPLSGYAPVVIRVRPGDAVRAAGVIRPIVGA